MHGGELFKLVHDLFALDKVADQTFSDVVEKIKAHANPAPNIMTARCTFNWCTQKSDHLLLPNVAWQRIVNMPLI
jgi:hypothetical protein